MVDVSICFPLGRGREGDSTCSVVVVCVAAEDSSLCSSLPQAARAAVTIMQQARIARLFVDFATT
jgi:hypothetical protein